MVPEDCYTGDVIHCHNVGIVSTSVRGDDATCGAFDKKGPKFSAFRCFIGLILGLVPVASLAWPASAPSQVVPFAQGTADKTGVEQTMVFDIPPQPLMTALRAYSEATGQAVLVDDALAMGRQSPGVSGEFDKVEALRTLLSGTGLVASYASDQAFTLKLVKPGESVESVQAGARERSGAMAGGGIEVVTERYAGEIQRPIEAALCQSKATRPGTYRLAMQIWIAPSGQVERIRLLTPTRSPQRDEQVRSALTRLVLDPPPSGMPQPMTLLLLPGHDVRSAACLNASSSQS
jgi:hypothetical protein